MLSAMLDAYGSPTDGGDDDERLAWHLDNWAAWMRSGRYGRGMPTKIPGLRQTGGADFEGMVADVDVRLARVIDAIIDSLPLAERTVIHHVKLGSVWRLALDVYATHHSARRMIRELMRQRRVE